MAEVVPIRPIVREKVIIHCNSDELAEAAKAFAHAVKACPFLDGHILATAENDRAKLEFWVRRIDSGTITVWSSQLSRDD